MTLIFCMLKKSQKTWIYFFATLKRLKQHEFNSLKANKAQKTWIQFFVVTQKAQKTWITFLQAKKKLKKHECAFFCKIKISKNIHRTKRFRLKTASKLLHLIERCD